MTDSVDDSSETVQITVPSELIEQIDDEFAERGYVSRADAVRDALQTWVDPPARLSDEILEDLATSREQRERGESRSLSDVADKYGVALDRD